MEKMKLIFFDEEVEIKKQNDFISLNNEIERNYLLNKRDISELLIFYENPEINYIKNNDDYKTFFDLNINKLYLDVGVDSQLYLKNLELVKKEIEDNDDTKIIKKITKIKKPVLIKENKENKLNNSNNNNYHYGIKCNNCNLFPIVGCRYKCSICDDFNICEKCEKIMGPSHSHPLIKINKPEMKPIILKIFLRNHFI